MAATIRDIKERTGLSLATISKYLNGGNVLPENREKIQDAIKELHYEVNELARGLVTNKTRTIGVVVFNIESFFNGTILRYIGDLLRKKGYGLLICDSCNDEKTEADNIRFLLSKKVDGMIVIPVSDSDRFLKPAKQRNIPVVLLDRSVEGETYDCVKINNRTAAKQAVSTLLNKGHRKIGIIYSGKEYTGIERYKGFVDAMEQAGCQIPDSYYKCGIHSVDFGYDSMKELLDLEDRPTAIFSSNYEITLGAVMALQESERHSWKDIAIVGFDKLLLTPLVDSQICKVVQPMKEMAESAAELLLKRIEEEAGEEVVPIEMVLSASIEEADAEDKWVINNQ